MQNVHKVSGYNYTFVFMNSVHKVSGYNHTFVSMNIVHKVSVYNHTFVSVNSVHKVSVSCHGSNHRPIDTQPGMSSLCQQAAHTGAEGGKTTAHTETQSLREEENSLYLNHV